MADDGNGYRHDDDYGRRGDRERDRYDDRKRERDRGDRGDRDRGGRDRGDRERGDRGDREKDRERAKPKHRSRSRSREKSRDRSRGRSREVSASPEPRPRRPRRSLFDVPPPGAPVPAAAAAVAAAVNAASGFTVAPVVPAAVPIPSGFSSVPAAAPILPAAPPIIPAAASVATPFVQPPSQQATRHARRVYVGGLPPTANEQTIATFFSHALAAVGGNSAGPGNAVVNVYINREKNFAFVEFRTVEETSNAMALDGIMFEGVSVRVRRPNDYNPAAAAALGPSVPNSSLNLAAIGLTPGGASITDAHERVFVGGLPYYLTEEQCRELLQSFGAIKSFDLVKDRETGNSKGYGFVVYNDAGVTDIACAGLNGLRMGDRVLTVRRATETAPNAMAAMAPTLPGGGVAGVTTLSGATRIVILAEAITLEELSNDSEYTDILEDMKEECTKYGICNNIIIPRPPPPGQPEPSGLGMVILEFSDVNAAVKARNAMHGRKFAGRTVQASYLPEDRYYRGDFTVPH